MDQRLMTVLQTVSRLNRQEAAAALISAFAALGAGRHAVEAARNAFGPILRHARKGTPQMIGLKPKGVTVVVSLSNLIDMLQVAAKGQSFGEALDAQGFRPVSGKKIDVREGLSCRTACVAPIEGVRQRMTAEPEL